MDFTIYLTTLAYFGTIIFSSSKLSGSTFPKPDLILQNLLRGLFHSCLDLSLLILSVLSGFYSSSHSAFLGLSMKPLQLTLGFSWCTCLHSPGCFSFLDLLFPAAPWGMYPEVSLLLLLCLEPWYWKSCGPLNEFPPYMYGQQVRPCPYLPATRASEDGRNGHALNLFIVFIIVFPRCFTIFAMCLRASTLQCDLQQKFQILYS